MSESLVDRQLELSFITCHTAKAETTHLELERKHLQQQVDNLEMQLQEAERLAKEAQQELQLEKGNSIIKQK